tara:strand:+ start:56849 stop:57490 length:642 start_codon:yes stop_codon:yes gene_type:complete
MKKSFAVKSLFILAITLLSSTIQGQTVELTAAYGYQFGSKSSYGYNNYVKINEGDQYSFTIGVDMFEGAITEVTWIHQSSGITQRDQNVNNGNTPNLTDLDMDWIMVGASKYLTKEKLRPFVGGGVGAAIFNASNANQRVFDHPIDTKWYLAFSMKAGANYMINDQWGLNIQANLMVPIQWGGVYLGTGGAGVSASSNILIGGFSGGLVYRMK